LKWIVVDDYDALSLTAAQMLLAAVRRNPSLVLGLPTGSTPEGMYRRVVNECQRSRHCFDDVTTFNLDEYVGISPWHPSSYSTYMREHLFSHIDIRPERVHLPDGNAMAIREVHPELPLEPALELECARYEAAITAAGSLELTFVGIGRNGHIGFNEPGTPFDSRTRVVQLTESTKNANAPFFRDNKVPERAITIGIGTILESRAIVLMASGEKKRGAVERLRSGEATTDFPASALTGHHDVTIIVDRAAAGE
jgi:glucosamine-6-phosphate deaminase